MDSTELFVDLVQKLNNLDDFEKIKSICSEHQTTHRATFYLIDKRVPDLWIYGDKPDVGIFNGSPEHPEYQYVSMDMGPMIQIVYLRES